ncbi:MAG: hypothetical protein L3J56_14725 [Bacteroidales bacterium]|nr:hypothetical protein [Bacteroidales bacterium]
MALNLDKIKSLFIVPEDEIPENKVEKKSEKKPEKKNITKLSQTKQTQTPKIKQSTPTSVSKGAFNKKIFESLTQAIQKADLPGEDYLEFMNALQAMKNIDLDEKIKMQTVLATLSTKGLTISKIIESADYYLKVLENEKDKFKIVINKQTETKIGGKNKKIKDLEAENQKKADMIKQLTEEINKNRAEIQKIKRELETADVKIKSAENDFNVTYDYVANQIKKNVKQLESLITDKN